MLDDRYGRLQHEREYGLDAETHVKGALVIFAGGTTDADDALAQSAPKAELELFDWLESVSRRSREICKELSDAKSPSLAAHRRWRWLSVIVDALDALELERPHLLTRAASTPRAGLADLVQTIESCRLWGVLLCGNSNPHKEPLSYLADAVLELNVDDTRMQRVLIVHKCRAQPFAPGPHVLRLVEGVGVVLHPNLAALQQAARRFARRNLDSEHVIPAPKYIYWPRANHSNTWPPPATEHRPDAIEIRRGAAVLLHGLPQSGKSPFLLNLMSERVRLANNPAWELGANGGVLIISFRGSERDALRPIEESRGLRNKWHANVSDLQVKCYGADDAMRAARIAHELVLRIRRCQRDGLPLTWIAFLGVDAVKTNLPAVAADRSFWPTILAITASEQISTAFVADEAAGPVPFVLEHRQDMDYVLRFARQQNERVIEIEKSADPPPPEGYSRIAFDPVTGVVRIAADNGTKP
jgi:KaiC/GvpD/RAD55 family RecA-like ATPase